MKNAAFILLFFLSFFDSLSAQTNLPQKNWIAVYVWDSFAPLTLDKTVPEMLTSLEVIFQQHATYTTKKIAKSPYGNRSTEGHFMVWMHFDDGFWERNGLKRSDFPEKIFMFPDRQSDIFTAWCGQANFRDFILDGVSGLANQTIYADGMVSGDLDVFENAVFQGNAEYGAGYYLDESQALKALNAILQYPGFEKGYSFVSRVEDRPEQAGFEDPGAQGVNGYNCNDFAFYLLDAAGVMPKAESEALKVEFWYPEYYWDHTIPLTGSGAKIYKAFDANRDLYMDRGRLLKLAWKELLFSGLDIFDERAVADKVMEDKLRYNSVRVWDQMTAINYWKNPANRDFKAKLVMEELHYAVKNCLPIETPYQEAEQRYNYRTTESYFKYKAGSKKRTQKKLRKNGFYRNLDALREMEAHMK